MVRLLTPAILAITGIFLFPFAANADQTKRVNDTDTEAKISIVEKDNTQVLAVQAESVPQDMIPVVDDKGRLFFNRIVSPEDLPGVDQDLKVVDTYTFEHNGRVYTNKIVADKA